MSENQIHPTAIIHPNAKIGSGNYIGPYCVIGENVTIGSFNRLESHVCIGSPAEHKIAFHGEIDSGVVIGDNCIFREFVTINSGTEQATFVGNNVYMLRGSHLGHDAIIQDKVTLSCNVMIGGHSVVKQGTNIGLGAVVHQRVTINKYSMVGMGSVVTKDIMPFFLGWGSPFKHQKLNVLGMERNGFSAKQIKSLDDYCFYVLNNKPNDYAYLAIDDLLDRAGFTV